MSDASFSSAGCAFGFVVVVRRFGYRAFFDSSPDADLLLLV